MVHTNWGEKQHSKEKPLTLEILSSNILSLVQDNTLVLDLEPLHGILLCDPVLNPNTGFATAAPAHPITRALQNNIKIHAINTR